VLMFTQVQMMVPKVTDHSIRHQKLQTAKQAHSQVYLHGGNATQSRRVK
jgi:hypothetical protein